MIAIIANGTIGKINIAMIGAIGDHRGSRLLLDCAKHALPYLYSKAPTELLAKVENTVVSVEDATESIKALLNIGETLALDIDDYEEMMYDEFDDVTSYSK